MTITAICGCRNEQDIIEPFVRHTLKFCDRLIISDNSVDDSTAILLRLKGELSGLALAADEGFAYDQKQSMTELMRYAAADGTEFIVPLDCDEFISAPTREIFEKHLEAIPGDGYGLQPWRTYIPTNRVGDDALRCMAYRRVAETPQYYKAIIRCEDVSPDDFVIEMGSHEVLAPSGRTVLKVTMPDLPLLHFPVRSIEQFTARIAVSYMSQLVNNHNQGQAPHTRGLFDLLSGEGLHRSHLFDYAMGYAQDARDLWSWHDVVSDDPQIDCTRKYSTGKPMDAVRIIAREWERSVTGGTNAAAR